MTDTETTCREAWIAEGLSEKTIAAYLLVLRRAELRLAAAGTSVLHATPSEIRKLSEDWPMTRSSRMQLRTTLARVWEACDRPGGPLGAVRVPSKPHYACRALSEPQAALLARSARSWEGREGLAVLLGLYAGLRRSEIASLHWEAIDLEERWLRVVGKADVTGEVPIHHELARRLAAQRNDVGTATYVFPGSRRREHVTPTTVWLWCKRVSVAALGEAVPPHRLRHTAIATLNDRTRDLRAAQSFARHASPETTVLYTRVSRRRLEDAVAAIDYEALP